MSPTERLAIELLEQKIDKLEGQIREQDSRAEVDRLTREVSELRKQIKLIANGSSITVTQARDMTDIKAGGDVSNDGSNIIKTIKRIKGGVPPKIAWAIILLSLLAVGGITWEELRSGLGFSDPIEDVDPSSPARKSGASGLNGSEGSTSNDARED